MGPGWLTAWLDVCWRAWPWDSRYRTAAVGKVAKSVGDMDHRSGCHVDWRLAHHVMRKVENWRISYYHNGDVAHTLLVTESESHKKKDYSCLLQQVGY